MTLDTLTFWLKAFVSNSVCQKQGRWFVIPVPIPNGTPTPTLRFCTGDQREFSSDPAASARMHSEIKIEGMSSDVPLVVYQKNFCGASHEVDNSGTIIATATADSDRMRFQNLRVSPDAIQIDLTGAAHLPLLSGAPDIVYSGTLIIDRAAGNLRYEGELPGFPFFEMYFRVNDGPVQTLAQLAPLGQIGPETHPVGLTAPLSP